jgi:hypothetical protein
MTDTVSRFQTEGLDNRLEEVRASVARQAADNRLAQLLQEVMLGLLSLLMTLLKDFRAGKLAPPAASACDAGPAVSVADRLESRGAAGGSAEAAGSGWPGLLG